MSKIYAQKNGSLNDTDRLEIARLLIKAGYTVRLDKEKENIQVRELKYKL
ncbi:hypothetical protein ACWTV9_07580 [Clostridioides difficile]